MSQTTRQSDLPVDPMFLERWSPRAFSEQTVGPEVLKTLFEAARWSPSASNLQPWRFFYALKGSPAFNDYLAGLVPFNQDWAKAAPILVYLASVTTFDGVRPVPSHAFDAGSAWMSLALQAHKLGLHAHAMGGIHAEQMRQTLKLPETYALHCAIAIGYRGETQSLPESLQARETPSPRQPLSEMVFEGAYTDSAAGE